MTDGFIRHLIAFLATLVCIIVYAIAYYSGANGWWFSVLTVLVVYPIIYKLVDT